MSLKVPFPPASTDYYSPFSSIFLFLFLSCALILVISFAFFSPLLFWAYLPFLFFVSPLLYKAKHLERVVAFSDKSFGHCHKILKVKKNALAAQKAIGSVSWCCSYYSAPTPRKLSVNHLLPPTQPWEEVCWGLWGRSTFLHVPCLSVVWQQCDLSSPCYTKLACSQLIK